MQHQNNINKRVNETLDLLNNIEPIESNPFLYEKIKSRMEETEKSMVKRPSLVLQTSRVFAMLLLVLLNVYFVSNINTTKSLGANLSEENIDYIIESYGIGVSENLTYN